MTAPAKCRGVNARGEACGAPAHMLNEDGLCFAHRVGGREHMRAVAAKGGQATRAKHRNSRPFSAAELPRLRTLSDAQRRLDLIQSAALQGRITHSQATAAAKAVAEWVKAYQVGQTDELVTKLRERLDHLQRTQAVKDQEIESLRRQLAARHLRPVG